MPKGVDAVAGKDCTHVGTAKCSQCAVILASIVTGENELQLGHHDLSI